MKILMIGSGGREHALIKKLLESPKCTKLYCAPGNGGISRDAELVNIGVMDKENMVKFAKDNAIDLVFVAPDDPLADGMVDAFEAAGIRAFGPNANAAIIEASKVFSKNLMKKYGIPTAKYEVFDNPEKAIEYVKAENTVPVVVKADGLALGKGVCGTAASQNQTLVVSDVHAFPGHIACDSASNSEIVVPIRQGGKVIGVLDIDSPIYARFSDEDRTGLESFVGILEQTADFGELR